MFGQGRGASSTIQRQFTVTISAASIFAFLTINYSLSYAALLFANFPDAALAPVWSVSWRAGLFSPLWVCWAALSRS